jgi:hypothetical protein
MTVEDMVRIVAGVFSGTGLVLGYFVNPYWFLLTAFVSINLIQSAFTGLCPAEWIMSTLGFPYSSEVDQKKRTV